MSASSAVGGAPEGAPVTTSLASALRDVVGAALQLTNAKVAKKVDEWTESLEELASSGHATERAVYEGIKAMLSGKNPVWAGIKGAWLGASVQMRVVAVLVLVLVLLLGPVLLLLLVLGLLVAALVAGIRAASR